ncbi:AraC family transcriptional regulator [Paenibacillus sp. CAU 1782]
MDWEVHIEQWSKAAVRLLDITHYRAELGTFSGRYSSHSGFFVVTTQGEGNVSLSGRVYPARSPHVLYGGRGSELDIVPLSSTFSCYFIQFEAVTASPPDQDSFHAPYAFTPYTSLSLQEMCQSMDRLWRQGAPLDRLQAQSAFLPFVYEVLRQIRTATLEKGKPNIVSETIRYINEHYKQAITAEELAGLQNCSASYLSRLFKNQIGISPIDYVIHVRVFKARQLLLDSEARIQEIAGSVGYGDVYYFSRLFKKHTGLSPLQYREENRRVVQYNPLRLSKSSIVTPWSLHHNENESYYQLDEEGETSMFRFSRPAFGAMMLLCTALLLSACQAASPTPSSSPTAAATVQPEASATATAAADNGAGETRMYEHLKGQTEIPAKPQRVVSLFHLGELMALGVKPVGATTFILQNPFLSDISDITDVGVPPDLEKILALEPDLIVTTAPFAEATEGGYEALSQIAPTIVVEQNNDPIKDVEMFGDILGKQEEARQWNEGFAAKIAEYKEKISPYVGADETFSILNVRSGAIFIYGDTNMGGNIVYKYLGLKPTAKVESDVINGETWEISSEVIPEFIGDRLFLAVNEGAEEELKKVEKLIQSTPAGQNGKVYSIDFNEFLPSDPVAVDKQLDIITDLLMEGNN